jgi:hypothetical protein
MTPISTEPSPHALLASLSQARAQQPLPAPLANDSARTASAFSRSPQARIVRAVRDPPNIL